MHRDFLRLVAFEQVLLWICTSNLAGFYKSPALIIFITIHSNDLSGVSCPNKYQRLALQRDSLAALTSKSPRSMLKSLSSAEVLLAAMPPRPLLGKGLMLC